MIRLPSLPTLTPREQGELKAYFDSVEREIERRLPQNPFERAPGVPRNVDTDPPTVSVVLGIGSVTLQWSSIEATDVLYYEAQLSADEDFAEVVSQKRLETEATFLNTSPGVTYYGRVRVFRDSLGAGAWSGPVSTKPGTLSSAVVAANEIAQFLQPDPVTSFDPATIAVGSLAASFDASALWGEVTLTTKGGVVWPRFALTTLIEADLSAISLHPAVAKLQMARDGTPLGREITVSFPYDLGATTPEDEMTLAYLFAADQPPAGTYRYGLQVDLSDPGSSGLSGVELQPVRLDVQLVEFVTTSVV